MQTRRQLSQKWGRYPRRSFLTSLDYGLSLCLFGLMVDERILSLAFTSVLSRRREELRALRRDATLCVAPVGLHLSGRA